MVAEQPIRVDAEWGRLEEAIVGDSRDVVVAEWNEPYHSTFGPEVNRWYQLNGGLRLDAVDPELADRMIEQQDDLARTLTELGVVVHRVESLRGSADELLLTDLAEGMLTFPRDPVIVIDGSVIEASPKHRWRRRERYAIRPILERRLAGPGGSESLWVAVPPPSTDRAHDHGPWLEGGDVLLTDDAVLVGSSGYGTNELGFDWIRRFLRGRRPVVPVRLTREAFHLDCALALLRPGLALGHTAAFVDGVPAPIADWEWIEVDASEQAQLATNLLIVNESLVVCDRRHQRVSGELRRRGIEVIDIDFDGPGEFGGGLRCSHHPLRRVVADVDATS